jgi:hypothetical protein
MNSDTNIYFFIIIEFSIKPSRDPNMSRDLRFGTNNCIKAEGSIPFAQDIATGYKPQPHITMAHIPGQSSFLYVCRSSGLFPSVSPPKACKFITYLIHTGYIPTHHI